MLIVFDCIVLAEVNQGVEDVTTLSLPSISKVYMWQMSNFWCCFFVTVMMIVYSIKLNKDDVPHD